MVGRGVNTTWSLTTARNNSLDSAGRRIAALVIAAPCLGIAVGMTVLGAWPVLPFAGLELAAVAAAFRIIALHAGDRERVRLVADRLEIEQVEGTRTRSYGFNRYWAQIVCAADGRRLAVRSHGREVEFGRHLTARQRIEAARQLRSELRRGR